jgi:hypothetical protein
MNHETYSVQNMKSLEFKVKNMKLNEQYLVIIIKWF